MAQFTITYEQVPGFPIENISNDGISITNKVKCAYSDRIVLAKEFLGWIVGSIVHPPHYYNAGDSPLYNIKAKDVTIAPGTGLEENTDKHKSAYLTIIYKSTSEDEPPKGETLYVSESLEPASEFTTLSEEALYWDSEKATPIQSTEVPAYLIRMYDWVYTIHNVIYLPDAVFTLPGLVNNASVISRSLNKTFATETLLCGNPSMNRQITSEGVTAWTITFRFTYRANGWNKFPRTSDTGSGITWGSIYSSSGTEKKPYKLASFGGIVI